MGTLGVLFIIDKHGPHAMCDMFSILGHFFHCVNTKTE